MDHSQSKLHYEFQKKRKISNTTKQNDNTLETIKKRNANAKTELGRTSIKKINNTYDQASSSMADWCGT